MPYKDIPTTNPLVGVLNEAIVTLRNNIAGWSSPVAREAHNLKVAGSNPASATSTPVRQNGGTLGYCFAQAERVASLSTGIPSFFDVLKALEASLTMSGATRTIHMLGACETSF